MDLHHLHSTLNNQDFFNPLNIIPNIDTSTNFDSVANQPNYLSFFETQPPYIEENGHQEYSLTPDALDFQMQELFRKSLQSEFPIESINQKNDAFNAEFSILTQEFLQNQILLKENFLLFKDAHNLHLNTSQKPDENLYDNNHFEGSSQLVPVSLEESKKRKFEISAKDLPKKKFKLTADNKKIHTLVWFMHHNQTVIDNYINICKSLHKCTISEKKLRFLPNCLLVKSLKNKPMTLPFKIRIKIATLPLLNGINIQLLDENKSRLIQFNQIESITSELGFLTIKIPECSFSKRVKIPPVSREENLFSEFESSIKYISVNFLHDKRCEKYEIKVYMNNYQFFTRSQNNFIENLDQVDKLFKCCLNLSHEIEIYNK